MNSSRNIFTCLSIHGISSLLDLCHELSRESVTYVFALCVTFLYALYSILKYSCGYAHFRFGDASPLPQVIVWLDTVS